MLNLFLAFLWLGLAVTAFLMPHVNPRGNLWIIPNTGVSLGWPALVFFGYNVVRWWSSRLKDEDRRILREIPARRRQGDEPPDPNFIFSDQPLPKEENPPK